MPAETRVRVVFRAILAVGLFSAAVIYFVNRPGGASDFELERTKLYLHDMEVYGGRANVLADEFRTWFDSLWHGRSLALTVAVISVFSALAYRWVATPLAPVITSDSESAENEPRGG